MALIKEPKREIKIMEKGKKALFRDTHIACVQRASHQKKKKTNGGDKKDKK
jgi:hypothetical protein